MKANARFLILFLLVFCGKQSFSQESYDLSLNVHESTLNKVLDKLGQISDTGSYKVLFFKGIYKWTVLNSKVRIEPEKAFFRSEVKVETGPFNYTDFVDGELTVSYDIKLNQIKIIITSAVFKVQTKVLGKNIVIKTIDLADYYKDPFIFDGPVSYSQEMEFEMPDGSKRILKAVVKTYTISFIKQNIHLTINLDFQDVTKQSGNSK